MDNNGWADQPGVPMNPERDGAHRLRHSESGLERDALWLCGGTWVDSDGEFIIQHAALFYIYLGPCLSPAEVDARIEYARQSTLEECIAACEAVVRSYRVELPEKHKDRPGGIPYSWKEMWENSAEIAEDIIADIRALKGEKE
jgi:hypothetical protein